MENRWKTSFRILISKFPEHEGARSVYRLIPANTVERASSVHKKDPLNPDTSLGFKTIDAIEKIV